MWEILLMQITRMQKDFVKFETKSFGECHDLYV